MTARAAILVFIVVAMPLRAELPPEELLPATTQIYFRWDGVAAHRERYREVTVGRLMTGEFAPFMKAIFDVFPKALQSEFVDQKLLDGASPSELAKKQADVAQAGRILDLLVQRGVIVAAEIGPLPGIFSLAYGGIRQATGKADGMSALLPKVRVTLIIPNAAKDVAVIEAAMRLQLSLFGGEAKEETISERRVVHAHAIELNWLTWCEGEHVILAIGSEKPATIVARATANSPKLTSNPLYQRLSNFNEFPTDIRGYVDLKTLISMGRQVIGLVGIFAGDFAKKFEELGPKAYQSLVFCSGFDGPIRRDVVELELLKERPGLSKMLGGSALKWDELPSFPPDVNRWSAHRLDIGAGYGLMTKLLDMTQEPGGDSEPSAAVFDKAAGIDLKKELFDQFGDLFVTYQSPSEGAVMLGQVFAVRVKDAPRVESALDEIVQGQVSNSVKLKKRACLDATIREIQLPAQGFLVPSYVVYKDWLVISAFPQSLQAFVQRAAGQSKGWEPDADTKAKFARLPKSCSTWSYCDLRPGAQQLLTFGPLIVSVIRLASGSDVIDVGVLPSGSTVIQQLTPSVTGVSDDGRRLRWDSYGGLLIPGDSIGFDPTMLLFAAQFIAAIF